jgi:hypothetical protein
MPTIPGPQRIPIGGSAIPGARPVAPPDLTPALSGGASLARGMDAMAGALLNEADRLKSARQNVEYTQGRVQAQTILGEVERSFDGDGDFKTAPQRFDEVLAQRRDKLLAEYGDQEVMQAVAADFDIQAVRTRERLYNRLRDSESALHQQQWETDRNSLLNRYSKATDDTTRREQAELANTYISSVGEWAGPAWMEKERTRFRQEGDFNRALNDIQTGRGYRPADYGHLDVNLVARLKDAQDRFSLDSRSQEETGRIIAGVRGGLSEWKAEAHKITDPAVRDRTLQNLRVEWSDREAQRRQYEDQLADRTWRGFYDALRGNNLKAAQGIVDNLPLPLQSSMRGQMQGIVDRAAEGRDLKTDPAAWTEFYRRLDNDLPGADGKTMPRFKSEVDVYNALSTRMSVSDLHSALEKFRDARDKASGKAAKAGEFTGEERTLAAQLFAEFTGKSSTSAGQGPAYGQFYDFLDTEARKAGKTDYPFLHERAAQWFARGYLRDGGMFYGDSGSTTYGEAVKNRQVKNWRIPMPNDNELSRMAADLLHLRDRKARSTPAALDDVLTGAGGPDGVRARWNAMQQLRKQGLTVTPGNIEAVVKMYGIKRLLEEE